MKILEAEFDLWNKHWSQSKNGYVIHTCGNRSISTVYLEKFTALGPQQLEPDL